MTNVKYMAIYSCLLWLGTFVQAQAPAEGTSWHRVCVTNCGAPSHSNPPKPKTPEELQHEQTMALNSKGDAAFANGDTPAALGYYQQALELEPDNESIANNVKRSEERLRWEKNDAEASALNDKALEASRSGNSVQA